MSKLSTLNLTPMARNIMLAMAILFCLFSCKSKDDVVDELNAPVITKLSRTEASAGEHLHIEGRNFGNSASAITVMIGGVPATVDSVKPERVSITLPDLQPGNKSVTVKAGGVTSNSKDLTYVAPAGEAGNSGYYLNRGNVDAHYRVTSAGNVTDYKTFMTGLTDSAGGKLYKTRTEIPDVPFVDASVLSNSNHTVYTTYRDGAMAAMEEELANSPGIVNFQMTGMPSHFKMNARPAINDQVTFSGPIRVSYNAVVGDITLTFESTSTSSNGKVLGFEDVQTPGGKFTNCLKWSYHTKRVITGTGISQTYDEDHVLWYAKGVGLVKDVSTGTTGTSTTLLMDIKNR